ncbi:MAG: hypothetical protein ACYC7F_09855 [Gemmatimonadaceae bacterium]
MRAPSRLMAMAAAAILAVAAVPHAARAQASAEERAAIAVADSLLHALSGGDRATMARLALDSALVGGVGVRDGVERTSLRSWAGDVRRPFPQVITERGFEATARVQGMLATVWMPYDLYFDGKWSHCGVDTFTLMKVKGAWRVAALLYTIEQPPACRPHPAGPPIR